MANESAKPSSQTSSDGGKHKQLDKEIKDMVTTITNRVSDLHKSGSINHQDDEDEHGVRIITLSGSNTGATFRSELDQEKKNKPAAGLQGGPTFGDQQQPADGLSTYVNSNFQAVNNSLLMGGTYTTNDPGVHVDITDVVEPPAGGHHRAEKRGGWKGKKKEKERESFQSDQHDDHDGDDD